MKNLLTFILLMALQVGLHYVSTDSVSCTREGYRCMDCHTLGYCTEDGKGGFNYSSSDEEKCPGNIVCDEEKMMCRRRGGFCRFKKFECPINDFEDEVVFPDPYSCTKYHGCQGTDQIDYSCDGNTAFDPVTGKCSLNLNHFYCKTSPVPICTENGYTGTINGTNIMYTCTMEKEPIPVLYPTLSLSSTTTKTASTTIKRTTTRTTSTATETTPTSMTTTPTTTVTKPKTTSAISTTTKKTPTTTSTVSSTTKKTPMTTEATSKTTSVISTTTKKTPTTTSIVSSTTKKTPMTTEATSKTTSVISTTTKKTPTTTSTVSSTTKKIPMTTEATSTTGRTTPTTRRTTPTTRRTTPTTRRTTPTTRRTTPTTRRTTPTTRRTTPTTRRTTTMRIPTTTETTPTTMKTTPTTMWTTTTEKPTTTTTTAPITTTHRTTVTTQAPFECHSVGYFPDPSECHCFMSCYLTGSGRLDYSKRCCRQYMYFNRHKGKCDIGDCINF